MYLFAVSALYACEVDGEAVMAATREQLYPMKIRPAEEVTSLDEKFRTAWILVAWFNCLRFMKNYRSLSGEALLEYGRSKEAWSENVKLVNI